MDGQEKQYILTINDLPAHSKPREKLIKMGPAALSLTELFSVILTVGTKSEDVLSMSRRLLKEYGEKAILNEKDPRKLQAALGIPLVKSCQLVACFEIGKRLYQKSAHRPVFVRTASDVYNYLPDMRDLPKEHLRGLYLNSHYQLIHEEVISIGSLTGSIVHPREVFKPALEYSASAIILAHNHPSGVVKPSSEDIQVTRQIVDAGRILGISVLDHVVITKNKFISIPVEYE